MFNGQAEASLVHINECITLLRTLHDDFALAVAIATRGRCEQLGGDYERAQVTLEEALQEAVRFGDANLRSMVLNALGVNAMAMTRWDEAESWLRDAFEVTESFGNLRRRQRRSRLWRRYWLRRTV